MKEDKNLESFLFDYFGYKSFRNGQKEAVTAALDGKDSLIMLPTGTGKSICYQLSGYLLNGLVVIVSPLLSLMEDQVSQMRQMGEKRVAALNSLLSFIEKRNILRSIGKIKFLFLSPEMLYQPMVLEQLKKQTISLFAIDEAHCISQWGFDFRPEYLELGNIRKQLKFPPTMALTATATKEVEQEIMDVLLLDKENTQKVRVSVDRPNIFLVVQNSNKNKEEMFLKYAKELPKPGIVYFSSKKKAEESAELLNKLKLANAEAYHSSISDEDKVKIQSQFLNGRLDVVCATSAFGMGIDKSDIRFVIHYHMPGSPEQYLQEIGRCGRDGKPSVAILLADSSGFRIQTHLIESGYPSRGMLEAAFTKDDASLLVHSSEVQVELSRYYAQSSLSIEQTIEIIDHRKKAKLKQLYWMKDFINSENVCLRKLLLTYFEETSMVNNKECCSNCQEFDVSSFFIEYQKNKEEIEKDEIEEGYENSWENDIYYLFKI